MRSVSWYISLKWLGKVLYTFSNEFLQQGSLDLLQCILQLGNCFGYSMVFVVIASSKDVGWFNDITEYKLPITGQNLVKKGLRIGQDIVNSFWGLLCLTHAVYAPKMGDLRCLINDHHKLVTWRIDHQSRSNSCWNIAVYHYFQYDHCLPCWICVTHFETIYKEQLVVFIIVQNLVEIAAVALIVWKLRHMIHF